jgi:hypothetical protein
MKRMLIIAGLFSFLSGLFLSGVAAKEYKVVKTYTSSRNTVFTKKPEAIGLKPAPGEVWGVLMETGYPNAVVTLVALADQTVSIYFSNGGDLTGLGTNPGPQKAGKEFISLAQQFAKSGTSATKYPLPEVACTRFYFLTDSDITTIEVKEKDLEDGKHELSPLYKMGHELLSEILAVDKKLHPKQKTPEDEPKAIDP